MDGWMEKLKIGRLGGHNYNWSLSLQRWRSPVTGLETTVIDEDTYYSL